MKNEKWVDLRIRKFNFNSNDMLIVLAIGFQTFKYKKKCSASEIRKMIDIAPNNLTSHLKKLAEMNVIKIKDFGIGKKKEISLNFDNEKNKLFD